jgi:hypothetical protein
MKPKTVVRERFSGYSSAWKVCGVLKTSNMTPLR